MAIISSQAISTEHIMTPVALATLVQSLNGLPNNPASLYFFTNSRNLTIYVVPSHTVNIISFAYLISALHQGEASAHAFKDFLENSETPTKVFFDARMSAKLLFDRCGIKLVVPPCTGRAHIHEVQMMELALRPYDNQHEWLAGLDQCIGRDLSLGTNTPIVGGMGGVKEFDERILYLPALWKTYHDRLTSGGFGVGGSFWIAQIREATRKRLQVSQGETHWGYSIDGARSAWDKESIEEQSDSWNEDVVMDAQNYGEWVGGAEYWAKFEML